MNVTSSATGFSSKELFSNIYSYRHKVFVETPGRDMRRKAVGNWTNSTVKKPFISSLRMMAVMSMAGRACADRQALSVGRHFSAVAERLAVAEFRRGLGIAPLCVNGFQLPHDIRPCTVLVAGGSAPFTGVDRLRRQTWR
jgi:hypothetical protein